MEMVDERWANLRPIDTEHGLARKLDTYWLVITTLAFRLGKFHSDEFVSKTIFMLGSLRGKHYAYPKGKQAERCELTLQLLIGEAQAQGILPASDYEAVEVEAPQEAPENLDHINAKLTAQTVMKERYEHFVAKNGLSWKQRAIKYGVSDKAMKSAITGKSWKHLPLPSDEGWEAAWNAIREDA